MKSVKSKWLTNNIDFLLDWYWNKTAPHPFWGKEKMTRHTLILQLNYVAHSLRLRYCVICNTYYTSSLFELNNFATLLVHKWQDYIALKMQLFLQMQLQEKFKYGMNEWFCKHFRNTFISINQLKSTRHNQSQ